jgi:hypothetical protein
MSAQIEFHRERRDYWLIHYNKLSPDKKARRLLAKQKADYHYKMIIELRAAAKKKIPANG